MRKESRKEKERKSNIGKIISGKENTNREEAGGLGETRGKFMARREWPKRGCEDRKARWSDRRSNEKGTDTKEGRADEHGKGGEIWGGGVLFGNT